MELIQLQPHAKNMVGLAPLGVKET